MCAVRAYARWADEEPSVPGRNILVLGASAGGLGPLCQIVAALPEDLQAAVFVCLHVPSDRPSSLPQILHKCGKLPAFHPADHQKIEMGRIYIAPPDFHLLVNQDHV